MDPSFHERRKLNEEIERTFINAAFFIRRFHKWQETNREETLLELYEGFYSEFDLLMILTCNLKELKGATPVIDSAKKWLKSRTPMENDKKVAARFIAGVDIFDIYTKALYDEGVIAMPSGGGR
jgi:hypothetical protein